MRSTGWWPYVGAIAAVGAAWLFQAVVGRHFGEIFAFAPFVVAALLSAWFGGLRPALVALALGYVVAVYFYVSPGRLVITGRDELATLSVYLLLGLSTGFLAERLHSSHRSAERARLQLRTIVDSIGDAVIAADARGRVSMVNDAALRLMGWTSSGVLGTRLNGALRLVDESSGQEVDPLSVGTNVQRPLELIKPDGGRLPVRLSVAPIGSTTDRSDGDVFVLHDATEERQARLSLERLRLALNAGNLGIWDWEILRQRLTWSDRSFEIYGVAADDFRGRIDDFRRLVHPEDSSHVDDAIQRTLTFGDPYEMEFRIVRPSGVTRWVRSSGQVLRDAQGRAVRMLGAVLDITDRKQEEIRQAYLAEVSATLASLVDYAAALDELARESVTSWADLCLVWVISDEGRMRRVASAQSDPRDPEQCATAERLGRLDWAQSSTAERVLRTGKTEFAAADAAGQEMGVTSYACAPLVVRARPLGCIYVATCRRARPFEPRDVEIVNEIAHRAATAIENALLYQDLTEAARQKDDFLAMLAHELRNPLAALQYANEASKSPGLMEADEITQIIDRQVRTLSRLIDDLLDVSRITRNKIQLKRESACGAQIARRAAATVRPLLEEHGHELRIKIDDDELPLVVDPVRIEQVLVNLLTNAAKYTPSGGLIRLHVERQGEEGVFRVTDGGIGIPPEMLPRVFELFVQVGQSADRAHGGLGIGLTIVRKLVELHGGSVAAHSEGLGRGSEFVVRLPIAEAPIELPRLSHGDPRPHECLQILVVDDQEALARGVAAILQRAGHLVRTAHNGLEALAAAQQQLPDAFVLDIGLPGMDGYALLESLRAQGGSDAIFLAMSGYGQPQDVKRSMEAGFDLHLVKPVPPEELLSSLADCVRKRRFARR